MIIKPIRSDSDYRSALQRVDELMDAVPGIPEGEELDVLATLVEAYEERHVPIESPDPVEFIKNVLLFRGESQVDLARLLGSRPRASEILNRKRKLTLGQVRQIAVGWQVPADPLVRDYDLDQ